MGLNLFVQSWMPHHGMMDGPMWGWHLWGWSMMVLWTLLWLALFVFVIWAIVRMVQGRRS